MEVKEYIIHTDGACSNNGNAAVNSLCGSGVTILYPNGDRRNFSRLSRLDGTNNISEYTALIDALNIMISEDFDSIQIFTDSKLVVSQINLRPDKTPFMKCKQQHLKKLLDEVNDLLDVLDFDRTQITITHVKREDNKIADKLSKYAIKHYQKTGEHSTNVIIKKDV